MTIAASVSSLEIPSKYEIIPIHTSDRASFKRCRRYWNWSSPARQNLTTRADIHGVNIPMFFGTGVHYALEQYYNPVLKRDPVQSFTTWFDIQWRGGTVTQDWLDKVYDLNPQHMGAGTFTVRGLEDILPEYDHAEWEELRHLGVEMMTYYKKYAEKNDGFEILAQEHTFSIPIWDYENNCILKAVDTRQESPNFGKMLEVHARGTQDAIWRRPNGRIGILEHKTAERIDDDYFRKLETDEQCTMYLYAGEVEAKYYNLPWKNEPLEEVIYNVMRKAYPKPPTILKGGLFSVDRAKESTTYDMLIEYCNAHLPGVQFDEKRNNYIEWLRDVGDEQFIIRKFVTRNRHVLQNAGKRLYMETIDMLNPGLQIYPNITNDYRCLGCAFRSPCLGMEDGSDVEQMIEDNYIRAKDR